MSSPRNDAPTALTVRWGVSRMNYFLGTTEAERRGSPVKEVPAWVQRLGQRLLLHGGAVVCIPPREPDFDALMERGQLWRVPPTRATVKQGMPKAGHENAAALYLQERGQLHLVTGYGFTEEDGMWRSHSWLFDPRLEGFLVDTTFLRQAYLGALLAGDELRRFLRGVGAPAPDWIS